MIRFGIGTYAVRNYPYPQSSYVLDWAQARQVDVEIIDSWADFYAFGETELATMREDYARRGLAVPAICATHVTLTDPDLARHNAARVTRAIDVAAYMGCPTINVSLVQTVAPRTSLDPAVGEQHYEAMARPLAALADRAAGSGIALSLELHEHTLVDTSAALLRLLRLVDRPNVGANPDLGNALAGFADPQETWLQIVQALKPYTNYWHVKNFSRVSFGTPGQAATIEVPLPYGDIDHRLVMRTMLADPAYDGYICIEAERSPDPFPLLDLGFTYLREIVREIQP